MNEDAPGVAEQTAEAEGRLAARERPSPAMSTQDLALVRERALRAAAVATDLKAEDVRLLDMHGLVTYTDYLVIATGRSTRQTRRIAEEIGLRLKRDEGMLPLGVEGAASGEWILMDYLDFVVHLFTPETREFYRLDTLWKQAPCETVV